nr:sulfatase [Candidatus Sigynarchaeota archaeon]
MTPKFNIVLLTIDALRYDHCGFNGYNRDVSPQLDKIAKKAIVFDNVFSTGPCTPPAFCSMFTATLPFDKGGYSPLPKQKITIAEVLRTMGYQTAGFTSNPQNSHYFGYDRGFMKFYDSMITSTKNPLNKRILTYFEGSGEKSNALYNRLQNLKVPKVLQASLKKLFYRVFLGRSIIYYVPARWITRRALKWLWYHYSQEKKDAAPFFLWVHYMDTHDPFIPKWRNLVKINPKFPRHAFDYVKKYPEYTDVLKQNNRKKHLIDLYDAEFRAEDERIGFLVRVFKRRGIYDQTVFIVTADHGEEFNDHGDYGHRAHLYNELTHVPFMIFGGPAERNELPGLNPGTRVSTLLSLMQLAPTMLEILSIPKTSSFDAPSILDSLKNKDLTTSAGIILNATETGKKSVIACTYHKGIVTRFNQVKDRTIKKMISMQDTRWKYIFDAETMREELYDLQEDPREKRNIASDHEVILHVFRETCAQHLKSTGSARTKKIPEETGERAKILAALQKVKKNL